MNTISEFSIHWKISSLDKDTKQLQSKLEELKVNEAIIKFNLEETKKSLERLDKLEKLNKEFLETSSNYRENSEKEKERYSKKENK